MKMVFIKVAGSGANEQVYVHPRRGHVGLSAKGPWVSDDERELGL